MPAYSQPETTVSFGTHCQDIHGMVWCCVYSGEGSPAKLDVLKLDVVGPSLRTCCISLPDLSSYPEMLVSPVVGASTTKEGQFAFGALLSALDSFAL